MSSNAQVATDQATSSGLVSRFYAESSDVPLEEILHYAKLQRQRERSGNDIERDQQNPCSKIADRLICRPMQSHTGQTSASTQESAKSADTSLRATADSAARVASWQSVLWLICTDIIGPSSAPYSVSVLGSTGGAAAFVGFGIASFYSGMLVWLLFLKLDSAEYPIRAFGDLFGRILGRRARSVSNILQSLQLVANVGIILLSSGMAFSQITKFRLCFVICTLIWLFVGISVAQIRTLRRFAWLASAAIWLNVLALLFTMIAMSDGEVNFGANSTKMSSDGSWPHKTVLAIVPAPFQEKLSALLNLIYAYGGCIVYCEFLSEMRKPMSFIKSLILAQAFIAVVYVVFGEVVYAKQGQYVVNPANMGIANYAWQTVTNVISLISGVIAACLYGNIGVKLIYHNILETMLAFPSPSTSRGKLLWAPAVVSYWLLAFVIAVSVPAFSALTAVVAAFAIFQFSYLFPNLLYLAYNINCGAMLADDPWTPGGGVKRVDTFRNFSRWKRGFLQQPIINTINLIWIILAAATMFLSIYASIIALKDALGNKAASSWSCCSPVDPVGCS
ncbi:uncharacterized protein L969DRAFT_44800 [Mixia osmundae IAM 14324]|uniref:Amino acid transporter transmembrane domain-containing protein n=1 Tax=Mixia osmundae (strain CBS 9802 / IAM 14324 / JCM 22182 / KY 12970) TaxID=764103 RepID=G7DTY1_MIXOS|nr:uncharacterized protein L969DRAFT_44800 [Mixia osmundae IAM 14324]KEI41755.1 hypothetical protein L969DRAFT_44800 [Mixia osmundae IAM 14324]GAA94041.1 hypothetical protein E5Q_00688 [Mixia osmundae IAM 14324]